ncbi:MAG: hypothetical protein H6834_17420 [Planctomycetes bacterium]|nr:hypothetical protein [Planctomycetota bacterium]
MARSRDATAALRRKAAAYPDTAEGLSCNQTSYKAGRGSFLFIGPGNQGVGFKAMFKLDASLEQATQLARDEPERFQVGVNGWVTVRFTNEAPLPREVWEPWLQESYEITCRSAVRATAKRKSAKKKPAKAAKKKGSRRT